MASTKRSPIFFAGLAILFASTVGAQILQPGPPLVVVDSTGTEIGHLLERTKAVVLVNDLAVSVNVGRNRLYADAGGFLFYAQPDCTGDAYFMPSFSSYSPLSPGSMGPTGILFVGEYGSPSQITALSWYNAREEVCVNESRVVNNALDAVPTVNLDTLFVPPFTVRPASSPLQAGVPMPELTFPSAVVFILVLCCFAFFRLRSGN